MTDRVPIVAGNWKMNKTAGETAVLIREIWAGLQADSGNLPCEVVVAPPFTSIPAAAEALLNTTIQLAGQNLFWEESGAFTGEVSGPMLKEAGCSHVIIGHSERRQYFAETDATVKKRITAAMKCDLVPIFCLGERLEERQSGRTFEVVETQLKSGLAGTIPHDPKRFVIAYEPVWAIGTGLTATPEQAQEVHALLRIKLGDLYGKSFAAEVRILYGGSVKPSNSRELMACEDIDGSLVGGASLTSADFLGIIRSGIS
ncbi:MAG: triose-phosphate isomerase [Thermodesulfobacteriota bacterium]